MDTEIKNNYLLNLYTKESSYINVYIENIIQDYNTSSNNKIEINSMLSITNDLLLNYITKNDNNHIDNYYKAYDFLMLSVLTVFWIVYKFMINDYHITSTILETYSYYASSEILKKERDILRVFDYNIYPILMKSINNMPVEPTNDTLKSPIIQNDPGVI